MVRTLRLERPLRLKAPAKLNLGLEVLGRRPDGYHELVTILQTVDLFDRLELWPADSRRYTPLAGEDPETDLVARALQLARDELGIEPAVEVRLEKRIPLAAGLGGGSSDAGTLLGALATLGGVPRQEAERLATILGSDVPFFVRGGTVLASGTGTTLAPLPAPANLAFVVVVPNVRIPDKTRRLYAALTPEDYSDGGATLAQAARLRAGQPLDVALLRNAFAWPLREFEAVRAAEEIMRSCAATVVLPSGAGPALFSPVEGPRQRAMFMAKRIRARLPGTSVTVCRALRSAV